MKRLIPFGVAALLAASVLSACGSSSSNDVVIGVMYPTTGAQGVGGSQELRGVRLAADWVNEHGGLRGRHVRLVVRNPERPEGVPDAMAALHDAGATVVIGSHGSSFSAIAASYATSHGLSFWETGAVGILPSGVAVGRNYFRVAPSGATLGRAAIDFVADVLVPRRKLGTALRYAVAYVDDPYGRAVGNGAIDTIRTRHLSFVGAVPYDAHGLDAAAVARRIGAERPDVLFVSAYVDDGVAVRQALVHQHVPLAVAIGTSSSFCMPEFARRLGADAVGVFASDKPDGDHVRPDSLDAHARNELRWVQERYRSTYKTPVSAPAMSGFSNALLVLEHVLPRAAALTVADVATAARTVDLPIGSLPNGGGYRLAPDGAHDAGDNRNAHSVIWQWIAPRTQAVVWPPADATHSIVDLPVT